MRLSSRATGIRPALYALERRDVPAAALDLTAVAAAGEINTALFRQVDAQPTGTGVISPFVRVQGSGIERGYNTDRRPLEFNENSSGRFTRSLRLDDVPVTLVDGVAYRQFLLDINQNAASPLLSLDELKIFLGNRGDLTGYAAGKLAGLNAVYDMDAGEDHSVLMNYSLNHGSGSGDVTVLIPDLLFATNADNPNPYIYLYSAFGGSAAANAGFEEWAVLPRTDVSGFGSLSGKVYLDANLSGNFEEGDSGLSGVYVVLSGIDDRGRTVSLRTITDAYGNYSFGRLRPGQYSLTEAQPTSYADGTETVGSLGGQLNLDDVISFITLKANDKGIGYNFGEVLITKITPT